MSDEPKTLLEQAKAHFKRAVEAEKAQRSRERDDLRFQVPELQWDEAARAARRGDFQSPPRPIFSVSKIDQPIQLVMNQQRSARLGVQIHPVSEDATDDTAEVIQGLYRHIERDSNAQDARSWAFDRACKAGRGVYRIVTEYDEDGGHPFDQKIVIKRLLHQESVYFDPSATEADFKDANWAFVASWVSKEEFRRMYPNAETQGMEQADFRDEAQEAPEWVRDEDYMVAEYFYKVRDAETAYELEDGSIVNAEPEEGVAVLRARTIERVRVKWAKLTGVEVLEEGDWNGKYIPLVPVIGRELQPFDDERRWVGMINPAKGGQKLYNHAAVTLAERMAMEPKTPFIGYEGQFEGHEEKWNNINVRNYPYVEAKAMTLDGKPAPLPQRAQLDQSGVSIAMLVLREADSFIQSTTAIHDPSLGRIENKERSGKAILALQQQADAGTGHYIQNLADISMICEANIVMDLIPAIYDRAGRVARILRGEEEKSETVILNRPFVRNQATGRPTAALPQVDPRTGAPMPQPKAKEYNLRAGRYSVSVTIGKSYQTRLQQGAEEIGELLTAKPELLPIIGDIYFKFRDSPGSAEIAERLRKLRERQYPNLTSGSEEALSPEELKAQVDGLTQQLQMLQGQLSQAVKAVETETAKQQAVMAKAEMDNQAKVAVAKIEAQTKLILEGLSQRFEALESKIDRQHEIQRDRFEAAHESAMAARSEDNEFRELGRDE